jgi:hypothetical protein
MKEKDKQNTKREARTWTGLWGAGLISSKEGAQKHFERLRRNTYDLCSHGVDETA